MTVASLDNTVAISSDILNSRVLETFLKPDKTPNYYPETKCPGCHQDNTMVFHCSSFDDYGEHLFDQYTCRHCKDTFAYNPSEKWLAEHKEVAVA